jgi:hypothetical protein
MGTVLTKRVVSRLQALLLIITKRALNDMPLKGFSASGRFYELICMIYDQLHPLHWQSEALYTSA